MILEHQKSTTSHFSRHQKFLLTENTLLVDIETTGLSPRSSSVYCIGCSNINHHEMEIRLFFAESPEEEADTLHAFMKFAAPFQKIITFNGTTFDLPFLAKRCQQHNITDTLTEKEHLDLFRMIRSCSSLLQLQGYKQKCIEAFLGLERKDQYNGGQLIQVYEEYVHTKDPALYDLLYIHNFEDVKGMYDLVDMLTYVQLQNHQYEYKNYTIEHAGEQKVLTINLVVPYKFPRPVLLLQDNYQIICAGRSVTIKLQIQHDLLNHYFDDYKNYYYLPAEETIIHKSVGQYLDPALREKVKKENCFISKECDFVCFPCKKAKTYLRKSYRECNYYMEITPALPDLSDLVKHFITSCL